MIFGSSPKSLTLAWRGRRGLSGVLLEWRSSGVPTEGLMVSAQTTATHSSSGQEDWLFKSE